jgi:cobalt transporter subunit CbtB
VTREPGDQPCKETSNRLSGVTGKEHDMTTRTLILSPARTGLAPILSAALIGLALIWFAGLSQAQAVHDAAHDARHSVAFPCH